VRYFFQDGNLALRLRGRFRLVARAGIAGMWAVLLASAAGAAPSAAGANELPLQAAPADSLESAISTLVEVVQWLHHSYVDSLSPQFLLDAAVEGICQRLDPQTSLLSSADWERLIESTSSGYVGIGVSLDFSGETPLVRSVQKGSPAHEAGIRPGDRVLSAAGQSLRGLAQAAITARIRGPRGSTVNLEIQSPAEARARAVRVAREHLELPALEDALVHEGRIGYVRLLRFGIGTAADLRRTLDGWSEKQLSGLVLDLRGNPGGLFDEAAAAAGLFVRSGVEIVRTESRLPEECERIVASTPPLFADLPVVILVDSLTASSAEVFAGALQGAGAALLAGEATYGKRTIQRFKPLERGGALRLTTSRFLTPADPLPPAESASPGAAASAGVRHKARLQPDLPLTAGSMDGWLSACDSTGLVARFVEFDTMTPADLAAWPEWGADPPADTRAFAAAAPGYAIWRGRLSATFEQWSAEARAGAGSGVPRDEACLRRLWLADWAEERWGAQASRAMSVELDPWVSESIDRLIEPPTALAHPSASRAD